MKSNKLIKIGYGKRISHIYYQISSSLPITGYEYLRPLFKEKWEEMVRQINDDLKRDYRKIKKEEK